MADEKSSFVYVTYIRTTPETLWAALTTSEFMKKYWFGMNIETDWKAGSPWKLIFPDGRIADTGEIVELDRPRRIVLKWRNELRPSLTAEGHARGVTMRRKSLCNASTLKGPLNTAARRPAGSSTKIAAE